MNRKYIIMGRKRGTDTWFNIGEKGEPDAKPLIWIPGLDNIRGAIDYLGKANPGMEYKAVRI